jgi:hypothetical protein
MFTSMYTTPQAGRPSLLNMSAEESEQLLGPTTPDWGPARARR